MKKPFLLLVAGVIAIVLLVSACSEKQREPFRDAPQSGVRNSQPADIGEMPDGFSNWAGKCDGPNYIYVIYKGNDNRGSIFVVANDPRCNGN